MREQLVSGVGLVSYKLICLLVYKLRNLRRDLITTFWNFGGAYREDGDCLFTRSHLERMRSNG